MGFSVLIPARLASTRLPGKPLADIGGLPMVVRVAQRAAEAGADLVVVAADDDRILRACEAHGVRALLTRSDHASGSDRLAEACMALGLDGPQVVVNVQGDEPMIDPALVRQCAELLQRRPDCMMSTAAHPIDNLRDYLDPNIVKVVLDAHDVALYFSRAPIPWRRRPANAAARPAGAAPCGPVRLPCRFPARVSEPAARCHRARRGAGTVACAVARPPHRGACQRACAGHRRRYARGPAARARAVRLSPRRVRLAPRLP
jgi:3-deoxy-D-manno-octulosonate cytidylyltransferase